MKHQINGMLIIAISAIPEYSLIREIQTVTNKKVTGRLACPISKEQKASLQHTISGFGFAFTVKPDGYFKLKANSK